MVAAATGAWIPLETVGRCTWDGCDCDAGTECLDSGGVQLAKTTWAAHGAGGRAVNPWSRTPSTLSL